MRVHKITLFLQLSRPVFLIAAALTYALGVGIARYLGFAIDWGLYILGQAWVTFMQLSTHYIDEYFEAPKYVNKPHQSLFTTRSGAIGPGKLTRNTALIAAATCLTISASLTVLLLQFLSVSPLLVLLLLLIFLGAIFYSLPPFDMASSGYGELVYSILVANLVPALALLLQFGDLHRLFMMSTLPLTVLHLAMMIALDFPDYATNIKHGKTTMLVRLGWQNAMLFHNILILSAYLVIGVAMIFGLNPAIGLPAFLSLPLALLLIWVMRRIGAGAKPNWRAITFGIVFLFISITYLLAFSFWTR